jgi:diguanylate cyclase (GGDEF)-like protein
MTNLIAADELPLILIADDDRVMRALICQAMKRDGYRVVEVSNGEECLEVYQKENPDIVLLDAIMPVMDGFACCEALQEISRNHILDLDSENQNYCNVEVNFGKTEQLLASIDQTPVLIITGLNDEESVNRAFEVGATDYVTKPINWPVLRQRVRRLIQQSRLYQYLELANAELNRLATLDGLTQLANRRRFDEYLDQQWRIMQREQRYLALLLCDVDFFKAYNDTYGHQAGDRTLQLVAEAIVAEVKRPADLVARYGGEELAIILPNTHNEGAFILAQQIRESIKSLEISHNSSTISDYVTLSIGVACQIPQPSKTPDDLIRIADQALYQAKANGRDRVAILNFV